MRLSLLSVWVSLLFFACTTGSKQSPDNVLYVDVHKTNDDIHLLFDSIDVTFLETNDSSLIGYVSRIYDLDSMWVIVDSRFGLVKSFNKNGDFLHQYGRKGNGPGEYSTIYDIAVDKSKQEILLLPPIGTGKRYSISGELISEVELPPAPSYSRIFNIDDTCWVIWSFPRSKETPGAYVLDSTFNIKYSDQPFSNVYSDLMFFDTNFSRDGEKVLVQGQFSRQVYEIGQDSIIKSYIWDFGDMNIPEKAYMAYSDDEVLNPEAFLEKERSLIQDKDLRWRIHNPLNNSKLRYIQYVKSAELASDLRTVLSPAYLLHIFYDKDSGESIVFNKFSNGMLNGSPQLMDDNTLTYIIPKEELPLYVDYLPAGMDLDKFDPDESNPVIARFYFKN